MSGRHELHSILFFVATLFFIYAGAACTSGSETDISDRLLKEKEHANYTGSGIIRNVPNDFPTIQAALDAAGQGDTVIVEDGVYKGEGNRNLDSKGKTILLRSKNGPDNCTIDCEGKGRGFYFHTHETLDSLVDGFTIKNAFVRGPELEGFGGGIFCVEGASPRINNCRMIENRADSSGGGIDCYSYSSPIISNCTISDNKSAFGGGISLGFDASPLIKNCTFSGNKARRGYAIIVGKESSPTIMNCTFAEKSKENIYIMDSSSDPKIIDSKYK
jgi:parallel beta-helix repeat protein